MNADELRKMSIDELFQLEEEEIVQIIEQLEGEGVDTNISQWLTEDTELTAMLNNLEDIDAKVIHTYYEWQADTSSGKEIAFLNATEQQKVIRQQIINYVTKALSRH